jgi:hypothetical protein
LLNEISWNGCPWRVSSVPSRVKKPSCVGTDVADGSGVADGTKVEVGAIVGAACGAAQAAKMTEIIIASILWPERFIEQFS